MDDTLQNEKDKSCQRNEPLQNRYAYVSRDER